MLALLLLASLSAMAGAEPPSPLLKSDHPVKWWFAYKFNAASFPSCGEPQKQHPTASDRSCPFGGKAKAYQGYSQQYVFASNENGRLQRGLGCFGASTLDPLGITFAHIYNGSYYFVIWNDQFYKHPKLKACSGDSCGAPWGHSKGLLVWDDHGEGMVLQVTTPSWPAAASKKKPRVGDGNTLGCVANNNLKFAQHFFALQLKEGDLLTVLQALKYAGVVTDPGNAQLVRNGGPPEIQKAVELLGTKPPKIEPEPKKDNKLPFREELSSGVILIAKPAWLNVPPWQMVSSALGGIGLRTATWWASPQIYSTRAEIYSSGGTKKLCWDDRLPPPGPVTIGTTGHWPDAETKHDTEFKTGGSANHAKIGVSTSGSVHYAIFGDMNQQGTAFPPKCDRSQNGRGGLFFVVKDDKLFATVSDLIDGATAPYRASARK